jgi:hypothetical protein
MRQGAITAGGEAKLHRCNAFSVTISGSAEPLVGGPQSGAHEAGTYESWETTAFSADFHFLKAFGCF